MQPIVFDLPESRRLVDVKREWRAKGSVWATEDVRRQLLILSQRGSHIQAAIEELCNETVSLTSLSESACLQLRKGRTKAWRVQQMAATEAPAFVDEKRCHYERVVISADNPHKWELGER